VEEGVQEFREGEKNSDTGIEDSEEEESVEQQ
jgi:hypothetical protein